MSVSGYSQGGGYPQYPDAARYPPAQPQYPGAARQPQYPGAARQPQYPGAARQVQPQPMMSTSFMSSPPGHGDSRSEVYSRADTSTMHLMSPMDRTEYAVDYRHAIIAMFLCPLIGLKSFFHTRQARIELENGNKVRAASHIQRSNTFYGYSLCFGFALWLFVLALIFVVVTHYLISIRHYGVSIPGRFFHDQ